MFDASAVCNVKFEFGGSQTPWCELLSVNCKVEVSIEGVVISGYRKTILFKVRVKEKYLLYYCQTVAFRCFALLFGVGERSRPIDDRLHRVVQLFWQEHTSNSDVAGIWV